MIDAYALSQERDEIVEHRLGMMSDGDPDRVTDEMRREAEEEYREWLEKR